MTPQPTKMYYSNFGCEEVHHFLPFRYHKEKSDKERYEIWLNQVHGQTSSNVVYVENKGLKTLATKLDWDTGFFGKQIWKIQAACWYESRLRSLQHLRDVENLMLQRGAQYVFSFVPSECTEIIDVMGRNGWSVIETRGLLYRKLEELSDINRYSVVVANKEDVEALSRIASETINPYDRFHSDDCFDKETINAFMKKWVENSILNNFSADAVLRPQSAPEAFLSILHRKELYPFDVKDTQLVLSAVSPRMKGWFYKLISEAAHIAKQAGADYISLTSQMNNRGALTTCQRLNMQFAETTLVLRKTVQ